MSIAPSQSRVATYLDILPCVHLVGMVSIGVARSRESSFKLRSPGAQRVPAVRWDDEVLVKFLHEIRDPVYGFVTVNSHERRVVDSAPVQRLRHISQLAMSSLVYPGATHRRFEHSLGVM